MFSSIIGKKPQNKTKQNKKTTTGTTTTTTTKWLKELRNHIGRNHINLLRWIFFVLRDNWKTLSFLKLCRYWDFFNRYVAVFFEASILKEVRILHYLHNNSAVLILMLSSKIKLYLYIIAKLSYKAFFIITFFISLFFA